MKYCDLSKYILCCMWHITCQWSCKITLFLICQNYIVFSTDLDIFQNATDSNWTVVNNCIMQSGKSGGRIFKSMPVTVYEGAIQSTMYLCRYYYVGSLPCNLFGIKDSRQVAFSNWNRQLTEIFMVNRMTVLDWRSILIRRHLNSSQLSGFIPWRLG